jgi:hypothetical protein
MVTLTSLDIGTIGENKGIELEGSYINNFLTYLYNLSTLKMLSSNIEFIEKGKHKSLDIESPIEIITVYGTKVIDPNKQLSSFFDNNGKLKIEEIEKELNILNNFSVFDSLNTIKLFNNKNTRKYIIKSESFKNCNRLKHIV